MTRPLITDTVTVQVVQAAPDAMIAFPFRELGITETAAARMLAARVPLAKIGRRRYALRSALLDAFRALAQEQAAQAANATTAKEDGYAGLVALAAGRK